MKRLASRKEDLAEFVELTLTQLPLGKILIHLLYQLCQIAKLTRSSCLEVEISLEEGKL